MDIAQAASKSIAFAIAAAQSTSVPLDVAANVQNHLRFVEAAAQHGVQWLVFPELSLTGYELAAMPDLVLHADHALLAPLREAAQRTGMAITVGAPVDSGSALPFVGAITLRPDGQHYVYAKYHLHGSETRFATAGSAQVGLQAWAGQQIASAICADTNYPSHAAQAAAAGACVYAAGILTSANGYAAEAPLWARYAREHAMTVVIANHGGPSGGYLSAGRSGIWDSQGELLAVARGTGDCLVIASRD
ncbi:carbon-nitrogen hydrolase family protein [Rhodoferax mekongensis]|uniref:Carbon-nitrogen hydrolase family protein n=1 Tax=Rhodoferax mekongensis TaxID=3068341 RepID=A0ABZ0AVW5_9BURK|nr:carbon-nitrogen hydrolase family protein [Rhodoferax sp. TBRC 17307]WNO03743.1 carbon-nitrogen hydrolase family protein [Rhodoferax sp. TBRC 17307]